MEFNFEEKLFKKVPPVVLKEFQEFQEAHHFKSLEFRGYQWKYYFEGTGDKIILSLTGGMRSPFFGFKIITELERYFKVLAPAYPRIKTMDGLVDGIQAILQKENIEQCKIWGTSFGGVLAQCILHKFTEMVDRIIIGNTGTTINNEDIVNKKVKSMKKAIRILSLLPSFIIRPVVSKSLLKLLNCPEEEKVLYKTLLKNIVAKRILDKPDILCHFKCLKDFFQNYRFSASDLSKWSGKILIIESDDDTAVGEESSDRLRKVYPQAEHYIFHEAGHMPVLSHKKEYYSVIKKFLGI